MDINNASNTPVIVQWGFITGITVYSHIWVNLLVSYTAYYFPFGAIAWSSADNSWYTSGSAATASGLVDIVGSAGYKNKTLSGFFLPSFTEHYWVTIGY